MKIAVGFRTATAFNARLLDKNVSDVSVKEFEATDFVKNIKAKQSRILDGATQIVVLCQVVIYPKTSLRIAAILLVLSKLHDSFRKELILSKFLH